MSSFGRDTELAMQLTEAGKSLLNPPSSVDGLLSLLHEVETLLSNVEQTPSTSMQDAMLPSMKALISSDLLKHQNVDVRVSVACCITEITRITAPDAPYNDEQMKEIFQLTVEAFEKLADASSCSYKKAELILDTVSKVRSCLVMLDIGCDELILEMFQRFFNISRSNQPHSVIFAMEIIMTMVIDESENVSQDLVSTLLASVRKENENVSPMSWKLGEKILSSCANKLKPYITEAFKSTSNSLDVYSPVVASICQNEFSTIKDHKIDHLEEHEAEEKKSTKRMLSSEPFEGTVELSSNAACRNIACQALDDSFVPVMSDRIFPTEKIEGLRNENPSNLLKHCSMLGQSKSTKTESKTIPKKRGRKSNSLMNPEEGCDHSRISGERKSIKTTLSSKNPRKKGAESSLFENSVSKKAPLPKETSNLLSKVGENVAISLPSQDSGLAGLHKRGRAKKEKKIMDQDSISLSLPALRKEESDVQFEKKIKSFLDFSVKVEPEEEHDMSSKPKRSGKSGGAKKTTKSRNKAQVQNDPKGTVMQEPVSETKVMSTSGKRLAVSSYSKNKNLEDATPDKVVVEASGSKRMISQDATKSSGEGIKEITKSNPKRKRSARKEDSKVLYIGQQLVGKSIKVWWPLDKMFYEGIIDLYDYESKKHRVSYADGDTELLNLRRQRWEFIEDDVLAEGEQEENYPKSVTLSEILQKQKENRKKDSTEKEKAGFSARRSSTKTSKKKDGEKDTDEKEKKGDDKAEKAISLSETETKEGNGQKYPNQVDSETTTRKVDNSREQNYTEAMPMPNQDGKKVTPYRGSLVSANP